MSAKNQQLHAILTKYDAETHMFEAIATDETIDRDNERMHYDSSKPLFIEWSESAQKNSGGKSVGNVRSMHGKNAAGLLKSLMCDDDSRSIIVRGEIVDPNDQIKMMKGVYSGVSIGANVVKVWDDPDNKGVKFYTAKPFEVSLVDLPCNPNARFKVHKADGAEVEVGFEHVEKNELEGQLDKVLAAKKAAKAVDEAKEKLKTLIADPVEAVRILEEAAKVYATKAAEAEKAILVKALTENPDLTVGDVQKFAEAHIPADERKDLNAIQLLHKLYDVAGIDPETRKKIAAETVEITDPVASAVIAGVGTATELAGSIKDEASLKAALGKVDEKTPDSHKRHIARCAHTLKLASLVPEAFREVPTVSGSQEGGTTLKGLYTVGCLARLLDDLICLKDSVRYEADSEGDDSAMPARLQMIAEDLGEALCEMCEEETREAANKVTKADMRAVVEKAGARHSKADLDRLQAIHDHSIGMGAGCAASDKSASGKVGSLVLKALGIESESDVVPTIEKLAADAKKYRDMPIRRGVARAVEKGQLIGTGDGTTQEDPETLKLREKAAGADGTEALVAHVKLQQRGAYIGT